MELNRRSPKKVISGAAGSIAIQNGFVFDEATGQLLGIHPGDPTDGRKFEHMEIDEIKAKAREKLQATPKIAAKLKKEALEPKMNEDGLIIEAGTPRNVGRKRSPEEGENDLMNEIKRLKKGDRTEGEEDEADLIKELSARD